MKKFMLFVAAMLCLVACNKDKENNPTAPARKVVLHATVENGGAANGPARIAPVDPTASPVTFVWEENDQVIIDNGTTFTLTASNISGNVADFVGEVAGSLDNYTAHYGYDPTAPSQTIEYRNNSFKPCVYGSGANEHFTLDQFYPVLKLQLKGAVTLGKIEYLIGTDVKATMTITGGIALNTTTATVIYLPVADVASTGFSLKFYDNAAEPALIMEKTTTFNLADKMGKIVTMPELAVAGQAKARINGEDVDVNWVQLWTDGPRWAEYNIGVDDGNPESYGSYFAWGETETKGNFDYCGNDLESLMEMHYADWTSNMTPLYKYGFIYYTMIYLLENGYESSVIWKYNTGTHVVCEDYITALAAGTLGFTMRDVVDNKTTLDLVDDAANANWGGKWRMPTKAEYDALIAHCNVEFVDLNGKRYYKVTGKETGYTDRSIIFPAAGRYMEGEGLMYKNKTGSYWTSNLCAEEDFRACDFSFNIDAMPGAVAYPPSTENALLRYIGCPVRAVYDPTME